VKHGDFSSNVQGRKEEEGVRRVSLHRRKYRKCVEVREDADEEGTASSLTKLLF